jgi:glycine betaine/proline transport system ATP-binding protein
MDEPFSALDPLIRTRLQDELLALQARVRKTILFVTHDLDEALRLGNQISILDGGRIIQTGSPQDIVTRPANDYVGAFVRHMNPLTMLTGEMVMRPVDQCARADKGYWLDSQKRLRVDVDDAGRISSAFAGEAPLTLRDPERPPAAGDATAIAVVPSTHSLQAIIELHNLTRRPVLVATAQRFAGVCGPDEIVSALGRHRVAVQPPP